MPGIAMRNWLVRLIGSEAIVTILGQPGPQSPAMEISPRRRAGRALVWFRRDLRTADHPALAHALRDAEAVWCAFVLDKAILAGLPPDDRRVAFIRASLAGRDQQLAALSGGRARL